jgi:hypothetical protein
MRVTQREPGCPGFEVTDHVQQAVTVHVLGSRATEVHARLIASQIISLVRNIYPPVSSEK